MKVQLKYSLIALILITYSCSRDEEVLEDQAVDNNVENDVSFQTANNTEVRTEIINRTILPRVNTDYFQQGYTFQNEARITNQQDYFWTWVAKVDSPTLNNQLLSATHCSILNNRAYVSYHKQGDEHLGMLEIIDISDPGSPSIIEQINFPTADINAITVESESAIWLATSHSKHGATVYKINSISDTYERINLSNLMDQNVVTASANGIAITNNYLVVSTGKTYGGTFILNKNSFELEYM